MSVKSNEFCVVFLEVGFIYTSIELNSPNSLTIFYWRANLIFSQVFNSIYNLLIENLSFYYH